MTCSIKDGHRWLIPVVISVKRSKCNSDETKDFKETRREWNCTGQIYETILFVHQWRI